ncbi:MAG: hypothetical protein R3240_00610, partial [Gammaproteobacteria bacterium]|nr:hypothetical protein [Gammaproteobacteria bacterium]
TVIDQTQPNVIVSIDGVAQNVQEFDYYQVTDEDNHIEIVGSSPFSANQEVWVHAEFKQLNPQPNTPGSIFRDFGVPVDSAGSYTIVVKPPQGDGFVEIWDNNGGWQGVHFTENGTAAFVDKPPLEITSVVIATGDSGTQISCWDQYADVCPGYTTDASTVTITGSVDGATSSEGKWEQSSDGAVAQGSYVIAADGTFTATIDLFQGWNWIDFVAGYGRMGISIDTQNGIEPVRAVKFTGPSPDATVSGTVTMTGGIDLSLADMTMYDIRARVWMYDPATGMGEEKVFSGVSTEIGQSMWDNDPNAPLIGEMIVNSDGTFSFQLSVASESVEVNADVGLWPKGQTFDMPPEYIDHVTLNCQFCGGPDNGGNGGPQLGAMPQGDTTVTISSPMMGDMNVGSTTVTGIIDPTKFVVGGVAVARLVVFDPMTMDQPDGMPLALYSTDPNDPIFGIVSAGTPVETGTFTVDASGNFSQSLTLDPSMHAYIAVFVWNDSALQEYVDASGQTQQEPGDPTAGHMIEVNGTTSSTSTAGQCYDSAGNVVTCDTGCTVDCGPQLGAIPTGSTGVEIFSPAIGDTGLTSTTVTAYVDLTQVPVGGVVRLAIMDPMSNTGPSFVMTNDASDQWAMNGTFTIDANGNVSVPVTLNGGMKEGIFIGIWDDIAADPGVTDPKAAYYIEVN